MAQKEVCSKEEDRGYEHEAEEEEELGRRTTTRKHDPRQPCEPQRVEHEMTTEERNAPEIHVACIFMGDTKKYAGSSGRERRTTKAREPIGRGSERSVWSSGTSLRKQTMSPR